MFEPLVVHWLLVAVIPVRPLPSPTNAVAFTVPTTDSDTSGRVVPMPTLPLMIILFVGAAMFA